MAQPRLLDALRQYLRDAAPGGALNPEVTGQGILDAGALATAPVPGVGDVVGLLADANRMRDPNERTPMNMALMALGALPFVPSGLRQAKKALGKADDAKRAKTSFEIAHEVAQKNAALPVSQGGLGLSPNNTARDRARAMGFVNPTYHASFSPEIKAFDPNRFGEITDNTEWAQNLAKAGVWSSEKDLTKEIAAPILYPLLQQKPISKFKSLDSLERYLKGGKRLRGTTKVLDEEFRAISYVEPDMTKIRSRFAAFDPMKRDSPDLLASLAPYLITGGLAGLLGLSSDNANAGQ